MFAHVVSCFENLLKAVCEQSLRRRAWRIRNRQCSRLAIAGAVGGVGENEVLIEVKAGLGKNPRSSSTGHVLAVKRRVMGGEIASAENDLGRVQIGVAPELKAGPENSGILMSGVQLHPASLFTEGILGCVADHIVDEKIVAGAEVVGEFRCALPAWSVAIVVTVLKVFRDPSPHWIRYLSRAVAA